MEVPRQVSLKRLRHNRRERHSQKEYIKKPANAVADKLKYIRGIIEEKDAIRRNTAKSQQEP